jgi:hypothetical protein
MSGLVTVIAGSRTITDYETVQSAIAAAPFEVAEVISGGADGVDTLGEEWAEQHDIPVQTVLPEEFEAEEANTGIPKYLLRNKEMARRGEALIAVWNEESSGTKHMIECAKDNGLEIHTHSTVSHRLDSF